MKLHVINAVERVGVAEALELDIVERPFEPEPDLDLRHTLYFGTRTNADRKASPPNP